MKTATEPIHYTERWQQAMTGESAVINKWRNDASATMYCDGLSMLGAIEDLRRHLLDRGFVRCRSL